MPATQATEEIRKLMLGILGEEPWSAFEPHSFHSPGIDSLYVITRNCSVLAHHIPGTELVLYEDNHPDNKETVVGFRIERVQSFCKHHHLHSSGEVKIAYILMFMSLYYHENQQLKKIINEVCLPLLKTHGITTVEFPK